MYLGLQVQQAFRTYVEHEEGVRQQLIEFRATGRPLPEWRRQFFLNTNLRPTRNNVIDIAYQRYQLGDRWVCPEGPHDSQEAVSVNRQLFGEFINTHSFVQHDGLDLRQNGHRNQVLSDIPLRDVHAELLTRYRVSRFEDSQYFASVLRLIQLHLIEQPDDSCTVFLMGGGERRRRRYQDGSFPELFQGRQYATHGGQRVVSYPGDRELRSPQGITIQMSNLDIGVPAAMIAENVPQVAVWIPTDIARDTLDQPQGGSSVS